MLIDSMYPVNLSQMRMPTTQTTEDRDYRPSLPPRTVQDRLLPLCFFSPQLWMCTMWGLWSPPGVCDQLILCRAAKPPMLQSCGRSRACSSCSSSSALILRRLHPSSPRSPPRLVARHCASHSTTGRAQRPEARRSTGHNARPHLWRGLRGTRERALGPRSRLIRLVVWLCGQGVGTYT